MKYFKTLLFVFALSTLASCATSPEPDKYGLVGYVKRYGGGQYYVDGIIGFSSPQVQALNQCRADGNKQVQIINSSFVQGASGNIYPALIFKCV